MAKAPTQLWLIGAEGWGKHVNPRSERNHAARQHDASTSEALIPDFEIVEEFRRICVRPLQYGHSRLVCDTPKPGDPNQLRWALLREVSYCEHGVSSFKQQLELLTKLGHLEHKYDSRGHRYRPAFDRRSRE